MSSMQIQNIPADLERMVVSRKRVAEFQELGWYVVHDDPDNEHAVTMEGPQLPDRGWRSIGEITAGIVRNMRTQRR